MFEERETMRLYLVVLISLKLYILNLNSAQCEVDYSKFIVWGPGLGAGFNLVVRYFFIQAVDHELNK